MSVKSSALSEPRHALVVRGGWDGHQPTESTDMFIPVLEANGFTVRIEKSPAPYADAEYMASGDLIMQANTMSARLRRMDQTASCTPSTKFYC